jgi:hypothetical protein
VVVVVVVVVVVEAAGARLMAKSLGHRVEDEVEALV